MRIGLRTRNRSGGPNLGAYCRFSNTCTCLLRPSYFPIGRSKQQLGASPTLSRRFQSAPPLRFNTRTQNRHHADLERKANREKSGRWPLAGNTTLSDPGALQAWSTLDILLTHPCIEPFSIAQPSGERMSHNRFKVGILPECLAYTSFLSSPNS